MASMSCFARGFVCHSGSRLVIFDNRSDDENVTKTEIQLESAEQENKGQNKNKHEGNSSPPDGQGGASSSRQNRALASIISPSGKYFAVCDDQKQLHLFDVEDNWKVVNRRIVPRRCTALAFTNDEKYVIVADKTGDVYQCSLTDHTAECKLILGHLSMLLDVVVTENDQYIITCDRDEKIRISHFPNCYNINTYCLGHTEYVTSLVYIEEEELLISGGGDGQILVWTLQGKNVGGVKSGFSAINSPGSPGSCEGQEHMAVKKLVYSKDLGLLVVIHFRSTTINVYHVGCSQESGVVLSHYHKLQCDEEPWDVCFDDRQCLWILQSKEGEVTQTFRCYKDSDKIKKLQEEDHDPRVKSFTKSFNDSWDFFKESQGVDVLGLSQGLGKVRVDNMKEYLQKKQERISKQKEIQGEPPEKKSKAND